MNRYQITFEKPDGTECSAVAVAGDVQQAILTALRSVSKPGQVAPGLKYVKFLSEA